MNTQVFQRGDTVPIWAENRTNAGVLANPSAGIIVTLKKPDGTIAIEPDVAETKIQDLAMTLPDVDGKYVYHFDSRAKGTPAVDEPTGWWHYFCTAIDGTDPDERVRISHGSFKLV